MKTVAIGILALLAGGCAADPMFDLVPRDPDAPWQAGGRWVGVETNRATVNASFDGAWLDHLIFDVEVVNRSDSTLCIDPRQFSFTLASSRGDLPRGLRRGFSAEDPAKVQARLAQEISGGSELRQAAVGALGLLTFVAIVAAVVAADVELPDIGSPDGHRNDTTQQAAETQRAHIEDFEQSCDHSAQTLLVRTELARGELVRGELWFPLGPLSQAIGPTPSGGDAYSITSTPPRKASCFALALHPPTSTGAPAIEYFVQR